MNRLTKKCIYCFQEDSSRFCGVEHVIPQSFGRFGTETPVLDTVCDDCNAYFGRELDALLARETLEGITRYKHGSLSREKRHQSRISIKISESPDTIGFAGLKVSIDGTTGTLAKSRPQFHIFNFQTKQTEVYLSDQLTGLKLAEEIYGTPGEAGKRGTWTANIFAPSKEELDDLVETLWTNGIRFVPVDTFRSPIFEEHTKNGYVELPVEIEGIFDKPHRRALAKVLMNFAAKYLGDQEILSQRWDFVRSYVRRAEGDIRARLTHRPFWTGQETETHRFKPDSINIKIENVDGHIVGAIQFYNQPTYELILVECDSLPPQSEIGYRFTPGLAPIRAEKRSA